MTGSLELGLLAEGERREHLMYSLKSVVASILCPQENFNFQNLEQKTTNDPIIMSQI